jgi:hypothetical protein
VPYQREAEIVLAAWRDVERELKDTPEDSPAAEYLHGEVRRLRDEYRRLIDAAREHHRPEPPPIPGLVDDD